MNATKERKQPQRTISLVATHGDCHLVEIAEQKSKTRTVTDYYFVTAIEGDFGRCFRLEKQANITDPEPHPPSAVYHVCLHGLEGHHLCDCRGFTSHGKCRHVSGLLALIAAGKPTTADAAEREAIEAEYDSPEEAQIEAACS